MLILTKLIDAESLFFLTFLYLKSVVFYKQQSTVKVEKILSEMFQEIELAKKEFKPDFVLVSLGLDGHKEDPIGQLKLTDDFYSKTFMKLTELSYSKKVPMLLALEGGYNLLVLERITVAIMMNLPKLNQAIRKNVTFAPSNLEGALFSTSLSQKKESKTVVKKRKTRKEVVSRTNKKSHLYTLLPASLSLPEMVKKDQEGEIEQSTLVPEQVNFT